MLAGKSPHTMEKLRYEAGIHGTNEERQLVQNGWRAGVGECPSLRRLE